MFLKGVTAIALQTAVFWWYTDHTAYVYTEYRKSNTAQTATVQASPYVVVCASHLQATILPIAVRQYPSSRVKGFAVHQKTTGLHSDTVNPNLW